MKEKRIFYNLVYSWLAHIKIAFTGLRPGEKLYEELLNQTELVVPTYNEKIKISAVIYCPYLYVQKVIDELLALNNLNNDKELIRKMKEIVPDYQSSNIIVMDHTQNDSPDSIYYWMEKYISLLEDYKRLLKVLENHDGYHQHKFKN